MAQVISSSNTSCIECKNDDSWKVAFLSTENVIQSVIENGSHFCGNGKGLATTDGAVRYFC